MFDQHIHSRHSFDSEADPRDLVLRAIELGLCGITFTEHYDTHPTEWPTCRYDDEAYPAEIDQLRREFDDKITIGTGIETCYQPDQAERVVGFLRERHFDVAIISVHWSAEGSIYEKNVWNGRTAEQMARSYLTSVLDATEFCVRLTQAGGSPFNILGHLDLCRRYARRYLNVDEPIGCDDVVTEILRNCLVAGLIPEINTSGLRQGLSEPMPGAAVIQRYAELGGTAVSIGSDAHCVDDVAADFDRAAKMARECGIDRLAVFRAGQLKTVELST